MRQAGEPTVEEILESIKKVIARDTRTSGAEERHKRDDEIVATPVPAASSAAAEVLDDEDILDLVEDESLAEIDSAPAEAPLVTEEARVSMRDSLAALAMLAQPGAPPQIVRSGETSLEGLTRELLRPALADWLDKHLPAMVERMVAAEISRIIGKRG